MRAKIWMRLALAAAANAALSWANMKLESPLFFDSIFTAAAAALYGPLAGAAVGLSSHLFMEVLNGFNGLFIAFSPCNIATGLIIGTAARRGTLDSFHRAAIWTFAVAMANSVLGAIIAFFVFGGATRHASDNLVAALVLAGGDLFGAAFWARVPTNLIDKGIATMIAFFVLERKKGRASAAAPR